MVIIANENVIYCKSKETIEVLGYLLDVADTANIVVEQYQVAILSRNRQAEINVLFFYV